MVVVVTGIAVAMEWTRVKRQGTARRPPLGLPPPAHTPKLGIPSTLIERACFPRFLPGDSSSSVRSG